HGDALVHRRVFGLEADLCVGEVHLRVVGVGGGGRKLRVPAGDIPVLGGEEEDRRFGEGAVGDREVGCAVEDLAGRRRVGDEDLEADFRGRFSGDVGVQGAEVRPVGGHPEGAVRAEGDPPGVDQVGVGDRGDAGLVGDQVGGDVGGTGYAPIFQ